MEDMQKTQIINSDKNTESEKSIQKDGIENAVTKEETIKDGAVKDESSKDKVTKEEVVKQEVTTDEGGKKKKKRRSKKVWIILLVLFVLLVATIVGVYVSVAHYYKTHYFQNTFINNMDCSNLEAATVAGFLDEQSKAYKIEIVGRDVNGSEVTLATVMAEDMGYVWVDALGAAEDVLTQQNEWHWLTTLGNDSYDYSLVLGATFDREILAEHLRSLDTFQKKNMLVAKDAYISEYSDEIKGYEVIKETEGTQFDVEQAILCVEAAVEAGADKVNLVEQGCYLEPKLQSADKRLSECVEEANKWLSTEIIYDWNGFEVIVDSDVIKEWVSIENDKPILDEEAVKEFVNQQANEFDTSGKNIKFTTTLGAELTLARRSYGWKTDREGEGEALLELIYAGSKEKREPIYIRRGFKKGYSDIGSTYVEADLSRQHLYLYKDGNLVLETDFVSGRMDVPGCVSPQGVFGLTYKTMNAVLRGADYATPVSFWMPFFGNFGMHDATWRDAFGGDIYLTNGSHGCLNLPLDKAGEIYNYVSTGFPIICYY